MKNIYTTTKIIIDGKTYVGAAIGYIDVIASRKDIEQTERDAIRNLLEKLKSAGISITKNTNL